MRKLIDGLANKNAEFLLMNRIFSRLKSTRINVCCEIRLKRNNVLKIVEEMELFEIQKRQTQFVGRHFSLFNNTLHGHCQEQGQDH